MIDKTKFTKQELKVIRKIIKIQIEALRSILNNDCEDDVDMYAIKCGFDPKIFKEAGQEDLEMYESLEKNPENFMSLSPIQMGIIRHILLNYINKNKYAQAKNSIWRKMNILEYYFDHNLN
jgi:hypothetical protein